MQFSLISDPAEWHSLEAEWQALAAQTHRPLPFLEFWYQKTWWQTLGGGEWPTDKSQLQLIIARQDGHLLGAAPLFCSEKADTPPALRFIGQIEVSDYLDFLCPPSELPAFIAGLLDFIQAAPGLLSRTLDLANFQDDSPSLPILRQLCEQKGIQYESEVLQPSPFIPMKSEWEDYLASLSKKQRHEIRRKLRNADSHHETDWYIAKSEENLQEEMQAFFNMMRNEPQKADFLIPQMESFLTQTAARALEVGQLHLAFLILDGQKAAGYLSFLAGDKLWVYNSGWNPTFSCCSPGWVLLAKVINWAIEQGLTEVDMMRGDEEYKYRIGGIDRHVVSFKTQLP